MKNSAVRGGCYPPRPKAEVDNILREKSTDDGEDVSIFSDGEESCPVLSLSKSYRKPCEDGTISQGRSRHAACTKASVKVPLFIYVLSVRLQV